MILVQFTYDVLEVDMQTDDYNLPPVKRQALIGKGLGHWLSVIDLLLQRLLA